MMLCLTMSENDLRSIFPLNETELTSKNGAWHCSLIEVSDLRPGLDRLAWYLAFRPIDDDNTKQPSAGTRKLEIVTSANVMKRGFGADLSERLRQWLITNEEDGRREWLDY